jgi:hypothetical protein
MERAVPKFAEVLANYEARYLTSRWALLVVSFIAAGLAVALAVTSMSPRPVIVVPGASGVGVFRPGEMPTSVIKDFAQTFTQNLIHFTPATARNRMKLCRTKMGPELQTGFDAQLEYRLKQIEDTQISQVFYPESSEVETTTPNRKYKAVVAGQLLTYVGSKSVGAGPWRVTLYINRVPSTDDNPYGIQVMGIDQAASVGPGKDKR